MLACLARLAASGAIAASPPIAVKSETAEQVGGTGSLAPGGCRTRSRSSAALGQVTRRLRFSRSGSRPR
jgi:hypothetical protein